MIARIISIVCLLAGVLGCYSQEPSPNIIVVFCDDMGYGDIGPFGAQGFQTPNIDRMADEGMVFTDFYVGRAVCTPSRAAPVNSSDPSIICPR